MKTLLIVRHAKSSWENSGEPDFERDLNERGKKEAPEMATRLLDKKIAIDIFISSPARRAKKTCKAFCKVFLLLVLSILMPKLSSSKKRCCGSDLQ